MSGRTVYRQTRPSVYTLFAKTFYQGCNVQRFQPICKHKRAAFRVTSYVFEMYFVVPRPHHAQNLLNGRVEAVPRTESTTTTDVTEILMTSRLTSQTTTTLPSTVPPTTDQVSTTYSTSIPPTEDSSTTASTREFTSSQTHLNITDELSIDAETISPERLTYTNERPTSTDIVESRPLDGIGLDSGNIHVYRLAFIRCHNVFGVFLLYLTGKQKESEF